MSGIGSTDGIEVDPARVAEWLENGRSLQVLDVREPYEREAGHIAGSRHIELTRLSQLAGTIDPSAPVVVYCRVGSRSLMAAQALRGAGYDAYTMSGGLVRWAEQGRPLEPEDGYVAQH
jgi:rhodanese-related sulfurtransferase